MLGTFLHRWYYQCLRKPPNVPVLTIHHQQTTTNRLCQNHRNSTPTDLFYLTTVVCDSDSDSDSDSDTYRQKHPTKYFFVGSPPVYG